ncbi:U3 small nucleolar RNA-associated protein 6 homolog [Salvia splendens]|uniref:U3 small nucleolar RNA-associated protein 6 homolog n=1 Tax=Salvia splendens TaxID=180675 RepID=UPI001C26C60F|nr:U3 small nucleolar RNA-associated protein 6 homolog [Salvia splendens]
MADVVQFKLERMLDELDDLERRGLFSRREIAEIVKMRRKFEYRLKRPSPLKEDFLTYIDYEKQLDALRALRKKSLERKSGGDKSKKTISDYAGVTRILLIYRLATNRFKGDIELWFQYLEFCRARGHGRMKKALAQLVRFHPKVPCVWIYAAAWEFDNNLNVAAARALMQNGLRSCPASEDLWVEYLRMELTYLNKLKARKIALGEGKASGKRNADEQQWREENQDLFMSLDENVDKISSSQEKPDVFREHGLTLLDTVYSGAIEALPTSFSLRTRFLDILEATELVSSEEMRTKIHHDMKRDFSKDPQYWDWLARVEIADTKGVNSVQLGRAVQVYEEGLKSTPSPIMVELYLKFLMEAVDRDGEGVIQFDTHAPAIEIVSHILEVFEKAESLGCINEDLACQHVSYLLHLSKLVEAKMLAEKLCSGEFPNAVNLWTLRLTIEMRCIQNKSLTPSKADMLYIFELLRNILKKLSVSEAESLWTMGLKYFANQRRHFDELVEMSVLLLAKDGGNDSGFSLSSTIVNYVLQRDGVERAREMYKRFLALPHPGLQLYRDCIELESNLASVGDKTGLTNARKLYESALTTYDQDANLWRDYHCLEIKTGTSETAAAVHWRARKTLKNNAAQLLSSKS